MEGKEERNKDTVLEDILKALTTTKKWLRVLVVAVIVLTVILALQYFHTLMLARTIRKAYEPLIDEMKSIGQDSAGPVSRLLDSRNKAYEASTRAEITILDTALERYYFDTETYPKDNPKTFSTRTLVETLQDGPNKECYYPFNSKKIKDGEYYSPLGHPYLYRENWSKSRKTSDMHNPDRFDIWTKDTQGEETGINNWGE